MEADVKRPTIAFAIGHVLRELLSRHISLQSIAPLNQLRQLSTLDQPTAGGSTNSIFLRTFCKSTNCCFDISQIDLSLAAKINSGRRTGINKRRQNSEFTRSHRRRRPAGHCHRLVEPLAAGERSGGS